MNIPIILERLCVLGPTCLDNDQLGVLEALQCFAGDVYDKGHNVNAIMGTFSDVLLNEMQGAVSIRKTVLQGMAIPMLKIRRPNGRLIFNMEIAIRR